MRVSGLLIASYVVAAPVVAQSRGVEVTYGRWWTDSSAATTYSAALYRPLFGTVSYGIGVVHLEDDSLIGRTSTGGELSMAVGRRGSGLYFISSTGLVVRHEDRNLDAFWSAGLGYAVALLPFLTLSLDGRYRAEDTNVRGFWDLTQRDRTGFVLHAAVSIGSGRVPVGRGARPPPSRVDPPSRTDVYDAARSGGATEDAAVLASMVVQTALEVMGTPYQWGGTDENGFDCSGLIKYAYGQHGLIIPRVSRDQARAGQRVNPQVAHLRPGDILGFSIEGHRITHVGLYIGDGQFIHSASQGVKISSLVSSEGDGAWWSRRWQVARRILN